MSKDNGFMKKSIFCLMFVFSLIPFIAAFSGKIKNFRIPLVENQSAEVGFLKGEEASCIDEFSLEFSGMEAEFVDPRMNRRWKVKTDKCCFDKANNYIATNSYVTIETSGILIDGEGMEWLLSVGELIVKKNVTVDLKKMTEGAHD